MSVKLLSSLEEEKKRLFFFFFFLGEGGGLGSVFGFSGFAFLLVFCRHNLKKCVLLCRSSSQILFTCPYSVQRLRYLHFWASLAVI